METRLHPKARAKGLRLICRTRELECGFLRSVVYSHPPHDSESKLLSMTCPSKAAAKVREESGPAYKEKNPTASKIWEQFHWVLQGNWKFQKEFLSSNQQCSPRTGTPTVPPKKDNTRLVSFPMGSCDAKCAKSWAEFRIFQALVHCDLHENLQDTGVSRLAFHCKLRSHLFFKAAHRQIEACYCLLKGQTVGWYISWYKERWIAIDSATISRSLSCSASAAVFSNCSRFSIPWRFHARIFDAMLSRSVKSRKN